MKERAGKESESVKVEERGGERESVREREREEGGGGGGGERVRERKRKLNARLNVRGGRVHI